MNKSNRTAFVLVLLSALVSACASTPIVEVPETQPGDQLKSELIETMKQNEFESLAKLAHRMNGAASNFGLLRLCALLARIETVAQNGTKITSTLLGQFQNEYDEAITALNVYLSAQNESPQQLSSSH